MKKIFIPDTGNVVTSIPIDRIQDSDYLHIISVDKNIKTVCILFRTPANSFKVGYYLANDNGKYSEVEESVKDLILKHSDRFTFYFL